MATPIHSIEGVALDSTGEMVDDSLGFMTHTVYSHVQGLETVYPDLGPGIDVVSHVNAWEYANFSIIAATNAINTAFHVVNVDVEACDVNDVIQIQLYYGAGTDQAGTFRFTTVGGFWGNSRYSINSPLLAANIQIRARCASMTPAQAATVRISLGILRHT